MTPTPRHTKAIMNDFMDFLSSFLILIATTLARQDLPLDEHGNHPNQVKQEGMIVDKVSVLEQCI